MSDEQLALATTSVSKWFLRLSILQKCVRKLNTDTRDDLKEFSLQTVRELLAVPVGTLNSQLKNNLNICLGKKMDVPLVPGSVYKPLDKTFRMFLDDVQGIDGTRAFRQLFLYVAISAGKELPDEPELVSARLMAEVFGPDGLEDNPAKQALLARLSDPAIVPPAFQPDPSLLDTSDDLSLQEVIDQILQ